MRRTDRQIADIDGILGIIDRAKVLHLGMADGNVPYVVAMNFGYEYIGGTFRFYLHSAPEGRKMDLMRKSPRVCVELEHFGGVLSGADAACRYGSEYSSVIAEGSAYILDDLQEKKRGLELLMRHMTGRHFVIEDEMASSVAVICVTADSISAKACVRTRPSDAELTEDISNEND